MTENPVKGRNIPRTVAPAPAVPAVEPPAPAVNPVERDPEVPSPPPGLSPDALDLWYGVFTDLYADGLEPDAREVHILRQAVAHATLAAGLAEALAGAEYLVPGSMKQQRVNPLVSELDKVRRTVATLLTALKQPVNPSAPSPTRRPRAGSSGPRPPAPAGSLWGSPEHTGGALT